MEELVSPQTRHVNLVLQGGGVKGIAYVGALKSLPDHVKIREVAGTSAGSIVAALLATGRDLPQIDAILRAVKFAEFLDVGERKRFERLAKAQKKIWDTFSGRRSWFSSIGAYRAYSKIKSDIKAVVEQRGLYRNGKLQAWLEQLFGDRVFRHDENHVSYDDLHIVASDLRRQEFKVYSNKATPDFPIADAVLASISFPLFFEPVNRDPSLLVDGGLLSNFPSYVFARSQYPTVGFRLLDLQKPKVLQGLGYLKGLLWTMLEAHDKARRPANYFYSFDIDVGSIDSLNFNISDTDIEALLDAGRAAGGRVKWDEIAVTRQIIRHIDAKPDEALDFALAGAQEAFEAYGSSEAMPDALVETVEYRSVINDDYDVDMQINYTYEVKGDVPLLATRMRLFDLPKSGSIIDLKPDVAVEGPKYKLITLPSINGENEKGYVILFAPPITSKNPPCHWRYRHVFEKDVIELSRGGGERLLYKTRMHAKDHRLSLKMTILIDASIRVDLAPEFVCTPSPVEEEILDGRRYRRWVLAFDDRRVTEIQEFPVRLSVL